jgi:hypothetical protein
MSPFQDIVEFNYLKIHLIAQFIGFFSVCVVIEENGYPLQNKNTLEYVNIDQ